MRLAEEILRDEIGPEDDARLTSQSVQRPREGASLSSQTVARRYATALADVVIERGEAAEVQAELAAWERNDFSKQRLA